MICPCCSNEMIKGNLCISPTNGCALKWVKSKHPFLNPDEDDMTIASAYLSINKYIPAFRCKECKQIVFSYDK